MHRNIIFVFVILSFFSCKKSEESTVDVSDIEITIQVDRFEEKFYNANTSDLPNLKEEYPFLFPAQFSDSVWYQRMQSEEEQVLYSKAQKIFGNFETEKKQLQQLFKYAKYYFPNFKTPQVITLISNLDYENKVLYTGNYLFISLDMFLGEEDEIYASFPNYIKQNFNKKHMLVEVAESIANFYVKPVFKRQFIEIMVEEGKKMEVINALLPQISDEVKMGYTSEKYEWITTNEIEVWRYFIENKLLYSTDQNLYKRFIAMAPFSKFYMDVEKDSPGSVGIYIGWQIVKAYMNNNNVTLQQMLATEANQIFTKSYYKPKK